MLNMLTIVLLFAATPQERSAAAPLVHAHAHNDYRHARPLLDALDHGFTGVEADVFLIDDDLFVAHDRNEIKPERTLRHLYLEPLRRRVRQYKGRVYPNGPTLLLLIDIKTSAVPTYERLHRMLAEYADLLTRFEGQTVKTGPVLAVISGNRPYEMMAAQKLRYAACDGRLSDLDSNAPATLIPLISDRWSSHFKWRGEGPFPPAERAKLIEIVEAAHAKGRRVRFWATPDQPGPARTAVWTELLKANVDLINTDHLPALRAFFLARQDKSR